MYDTNPPSGINTIESEFFRGCSPSGLGHCESSSVYYLLEVMKSTRLAPHQHQSLTDEEETQETENREQAISFSQVHNNFQCTQQS